MKATATIILFTSKKLKNDSGYHPVVLRITHGGKRRYYTLGAATKEDFKGSRYKKSKEKNIKLAAIEQKANQIILELLNTEKGFTFERFNRRYSGQKNDNVLSYIEYLKKSLIDQDKASALITTKSLLKHLSNFRTDQGGKVKDFTFMDIDVSFLQKFETHLRKTCNTNGVGVYMRQLRSIYNKDPQRKYSQENPFKEYSIKIESTAKRALRKADIQLIINYPAETETSLFHHRNYFAFSYLCRGMNFTDIATLKHTDIVSERIVYQRAKTKTQFNIPVRGLVREIINYYRKNHFTGSGYVFPIITKEYATAVALKWAIKKKLNNLNKDLKLIAAAVGITNPEKMTSYMARHSWATITKKQGVSTELIKEALGHGNIKTTETYLAQFDTDELDKADQFLDEDFKTLNINRNAG